MIMFKGFLEYESQTNLELDTVQLQIINLILGSTIRDSPFNNYFIKNSFKISTNYNYELIMIIKLIKYP